MNIKLKDHQRIEIKELFDTGVPTKEIALRYSISKTTVLAVIKNLGGKHKTSSERHRKYKLNEDCFGDFKSEQSLYFYGLLLGDGNVSKDRKRVSISLQTSDIKILDKFKCFLETDRPFSEGRNITKLVIDSEKIYNKLVENFLEPAKSTKERVPKFYNRFDINMRHFWRGLIDADGSLFIGSQGKERLSLVSSLEIITEFSEFVKHHTGVKITSIQNHSKSKDCFYANYHCRNALYVSDLLYKDSSISLDRKYDKYKLLMSKEQRFIVKDENRYLYYAKDRDSWRVYIKIAKSPFRDNPPVYLGNFKDKEDAKRERDEFLEVMK